MPRLARAIVTVLALAALAVLVAAPPAAAQGQKDVTVKVTCRPNDDGPGSVEVDPWLLLLDQGDETTWKLKITNSSKNQIVVEPKKGKGWPYKATKHEGGEGEAHSKGMKDNAKGDYTYDIKIYCNDKEVVIDPRVRVR